jgi:4-hydroxy-tetrahydrodipicolinate synthase
LEVTNKTSRVTPIDASELHATPAPRTFDGVVAAMLTPYREPGNIDAAVATRYAERLATGGCDGLFILSSTGGLPFLEEAERRTLVAATRRGCPREKTLYAGVSGMGLKETIRNARHAAAEGADAVVVMSPFFLHVSQGELYHYFAGLADASPVPVCVYHHLRMPTPIAVETIARLAEHPNVVAMKETSADENRLEALLRATRGAKLTVLQGSEPLLLRTLRGGGHGCVTALAAIAPEWHRDMLAAWRTGREGDAARAELRIVDLWQMFLLPQMKTSFGYFARSLMLAARARGWIDSTASMLPGFEPDESFDRAIDAHLKRIGFFELAADNGRSIS